MLDELFEKVRAQQTEPQEEVTPQDPFMKLIEMASLCGSRYFAQKFPGEIQINSDTDYDYFIQSSPEVYAILDKSSAQMLIGRLVINDIMSVTSPRYPMDDLAEAIYEYVYPPTGRTYQLVVRSDAKLYKKVINTITPEFYKTYLWKSSKTKEPYVDSRLIMAIFNQLFRTSK